MTSPTLPEQVADAARSIVETLRQTTYQYAEDIDPDQGVYDCDCNSFVGFVLQRCAPAQYAMIPQEPGRPRPRAFEYQDFFDSLTHDPTNGWRSVPVLGDARRGDIIAWRRPVLESGVDTGHVLIVAAAPEADDQGVWTVEEYDSASRPHFDDTRGDGDGQYPSGVGHGHLKFEVDGDGRPVAFLFSPTAPGFTSYPIAIGRVEPVEDPAD